jgi:Family of unknown function (DUF5324)
VARKDSARVQNEHVEVTVRDKSGIVATRLVPLAGSARLTAAQKAAAARVWATPRVTAARGRAEEYVPRIAEAVGAAIAASQPVRNEAVARGGLALAALKGEQLQVVSKKRRGVRVRRVLVFLGLAGTAASAVAWWRSQQQPVAPWEDSGSASSRSTVYPATGGTGATGTSSADTTTTGSSMDSSTDTSEPPGPVLATSASSEPLDGETADDLTTPSTAMGTTSESTSADPGAQATSETPSADDASTVDIATDPATASLAKTTRARSRSTKTDTT